VCPWSCSLLILFSQTSPTTVNLFPCQVIKVEGGEEIVNVNLTPNKIPKLYKVLLVGFFGAVFTKNMNFIQSERDKFMESLSFCRK